MTVSEWEKLPESKSKTLLAIRADIQNSYDKIKNVVQELEFEGGFSFDALNTRLGKNNSDTLNIAFNAKIQTLLDNEQVGSHLYYKDALKSVEQFAGTKIQFTSVNVDWLKRYEKHLLNAGRGFTTIGMYCRAIRCIMNEACKSGVIIRQSISVWKW